MTFLPFVFPGFISTNYGVSSAVVLNIISLGSIISILNIPAEVRLGVPNEVFVIQRPTPVVGQILHGGDV